jgi:Tetracyclin repressor-like, C-terminal domain
MSDCSLDHASIVPPSAVGVPVTAAARFGVADAELRVELVASHMVGPAFARYQLKIEPIASAGIEDLLVWVGPTVQRYLTDPNP